ncbi:MAG: MBL fold metallo-hydrolase [Candidatus Omnitrophica bacterium]|nr:MBL fold metallo-hydrolase [Candidatus Omnitrophota bacterium]
MAKIVILGTAGAVFSQKRNNTSFLLQNKKELILIDTPACLLSKLDQIKIDFRNIRHILFTHSHPDHLTGIIYLIHSQYGLKNRIHIYASENTIRLIKKIRKLFSLEDTEIYPELIFHSFKKERPVFYRSKDLLIYFFKTKHSSDSVGFKIIFKNKTIIISGDSPFDQNIIKEAMNSFILIYDCFAPERFFKKYSLLNQKHTSSLNLGKIASLSKTKLLIPIHFSGELKYSFQEIIKEIRENYSGRLIIPEDLMVISL